MFTLFSLASLLQPSKLKPFICLMLQRPACNPGHICPPIGCKCPRTSSFLFYSSFRDPLANDQLLGFSTFRSYSYPLANYYRLGFSTFRSYSDPPATPVSSTGYISSMAAGMPGSPSLFNSASSSKAKPNIHVGLHLLPIITSNVQTEIH